MSKPVMQKKAVNKNVKIGDKKDIKKQEKAGKGVVKSYYRVFHDAFILNQMDSKKHDTKGDLAKEISKQL